VYLKTVPKIDTLPQHAAHTFSTVFIPS